ncbi:hypothetical protein C3942_16920 [Solimonas fluminis]|uniref:Uncharacterized protein n=1 Tax=Solimonas fluminis TaxID=2086571 RepID=A0A2S5TCK8_9GAMM|nr:hypothetical protein C3942_16920 [Solimonas fluminis]
MADGLDLLLRFLATAAALGVGYGAIRADLKNLHSQVEQVKETADTAHRRIDSLLMRRVK